MTFTGQVIGSSMQVAYCLCWKCQMSNHIGKLSRSPFWYITATFFFFFLQSNQFQMDRVKSWPTFCLLNTPFHLQMYHSPEAQCVANAALVWIPNKLTVLEQKYAAAIINSDFLFIFLYIKTVLVEASVHKEYKLQIIPKSIHTTKTHQKHNLQVLCILFTALCDLGSTFSCMLFLSIRIQT